MTAPSAASAAWRWRWPLRRLSVAPASRDGWAVAALTVLVFAVSTLFELHEGVAVVAQRFEALQLDELPLALLAAALGSAWIARRRSRDIGTELGRRIAAEAEALALAEHNRELTRRLLSVQEAERRALARELHDEIGQRCAAIRFEAACLDRCTDADALRGAARRTADSVEALSDGVRRLLQRLRPAELDALGLVAALQSLAEAWETRSGVAHAFHHDASLPALGDDAEMAIFRIAQESLSNVARHAAASQVRLRLVRSTGKSIRLDVEDDGRGFDHRTRHPAGLGLLGAAERAAALGGTLTLDSAPGRGTRLSVELPLAPAPR